MADGTQRTRKASAGGSTGFSAEERAAMRERARELRAEARAGKNRQSGEEAVRAKIAELPEPDRTMAERIHAVVTTAAPRLLPRTWYGMPAYATEDGAVVCYFTPASKFNSRYATFGFNDAAKLDDGNMWPTSFALTTLTEREEERIADLVKRAVG